MEIKRITRFSPNLLSDLQVVIEQLTPDRVLKAKNIKALLADKTMRLFGVFDGKRLVGTATLVLVLKLGGIRAVVEDVVVDSAYRGRGLGEKLMREVLKDARKCKAEKVSLTSRHDRVVAHALYKKLGFTIKETNVFQLKF